MQKENRVQSPKIKFVIGRPSHLRIYSAMMPKVYELAYANEKLGLKPRYFSAKLFSSKRIVAYFARKLEQKRGKRTWLAFVGKRLVGTMTVERKEGSCELSGLYITKDMQGKGLGRILMDKAMRFAGNRKAHMYLIAHNKKAIEIYKKWGFKKYGKTFYDHWPEWPKRVKMGIMRMRIQEGMYRFKDSK